MAHGRVFLTGPDGDSLLDSLQQRITEAGYWPQNPGLGREAIYGMAASALPIVAAFDLWSTLDTEHGAFLQAMDAQMPAGSPLLALCETTHVDALAPYLKRRGRLIGFSTLSAPGSTGLMELLPAAGATDEAIRRAAMFAGSLGYQIETLPRSARAVLPRLLATVVNEASYLLGEGGARAEDIDLALRTAGRFVHSPLVVADEIGLDRIVSILEALQQEFESERYRPAPYLRHLIRTGATGRASGRGFHRYALLEVPGDHV